MSMARALRRTTLSPQIQQERHICGNGSSSGSSSGSTSKKSGINGMLQNGGGSVLFHEEKTYEHNNNVHSQQNYVSSLPCLTGGMAGPTGFSSAPPPSSASHSDNLLSLANLSVIFPLPCLRLMGRTGGSMERPPKSSRGVFLKRPMLHLLLCLVLGIIMGFSSIRWSDFSSPARNDVPHDLALVNGFVTKLRREGSQTVSRGENLRKTHDSWRASTVVGKIADVTTGADNSRALQIERLGSGLLQLAPGLNYSLDPERKLLIIVTPTYNRAFQAHYLTRLAHALRLVPPPLLWLVVEMPFQTLETALFLRQTGIMYRHLVCRNNFTNVKHRSIHQRNFALEHIEMHQLNGIVYFADDDNVYSQDLFEQMRRISRFGTWLVGILAESKEKVILEGPVCDGERVIGWHTDEKSKKMRRFHVDMSGFAFNSSMLWDTTNWRHRSEEPIRQLATVKEGLQETAFIEQLVEDEDQMQGLPNGCSQIMVWNLNMEAPELAYPYGWSLARPLFPNIPLQTRT